MRAKDLKPQFKGKLKIYLDLDGVLADFFAEYAKMAGVKPNKYGRHEYRSIPAHLKDPTLEKMIGTDFFARLPKFPTTDALIKMTVDSFGSYNICSSPLRNDEKNSEHYKKIWIREHLHPKPNEIIITSVKANYAMQENGMPNILVDDRGNNIRDWELAGGLGIKYQADEDPLEKVAQGYHRILKVFT